MPEATETAEDRFVAIDLLPEVEMCRLYCRFLETADEYFEYPSRASRQGRWNIYGIFSGRCSA